MLTFAWSRRCTVATCQSSSGVGLIRACLGPCPSWFMHSICSLKFQVWESLLQDVYVATSWDVEEELNASAYHNLRYKCFWLFPFSRSCFLPKLNGSLVHGEDPRFNFSHPQFFFKEPCTLVQDKSCDGELLPIKVDSHGTGRPVLWSSIRQFNMFIHFSTNTSSCDLIAVSSWVINLFFFFSYWSSCMFTFFLSRKADEAIPSLLLGRTQEPAVLLN